MAAAAEVSHGGPVKLVLTGRAENHIHGIQDLADTIARLQRYQEAGADVLLRLSQRSITGDVQVSRTRFRSPTIASGQP